MVRVVVSCLPAYAPATMASSVTAATRHTPSKRLFTGSLPAARGRRPGGGYETIERWGRRTETREPRPKARPGDRRGRARRRRNEDRRRRRRRDNGSCPESPSA